MRESFIKQHFAPTPLDGRVSAGPGEDDKLWCEYYSDRARYNPEDLFIEQAIQSFHDSLDASPIFKNAIILGMFLTISFTVLQLIFAFVESKLPFSYGSMVASIPFAGDYLRRFAQVELFGLGLGFLVLTLMGLTGALIVDVFRLGRLEKIVNDARRLRDDLNKLVAGASQIFVSSGNIRFSHGKKGLRIDGGNLDVYFAWASIDCEVILIKQNIVLKRDYFISLRPRRLASLTRTEEVEEADYALVKLRNDVDLAAKDSTWRKDGRVVKFDEFLVIPKARFFTSDRNSSDWEKYVTSLKERPECPIDNKLS